MAPMTQTNPRRTAPPPRRRRAARKRRSLRPLILLLALVLVLGVAGWALLHGESSVGPGAGPSASTSPKPMPVTKVSAELLPPLAQSSVRPASADKAAPVVQVTAQTVKDDSKVTLQERRAGSWVDVSTLALDKQGTATFEAPSTRADRGRPLRVVSTVNHDVRSAALDPRTWAVGFEDQFDGDALDTTKWDYRLQGVLMDPGRTKSESSPDAVRLENGALKLSVLPNPVRGAGYYLNGHISTEMSYSFTYGVAAARVKFEKPRGMHGGFWMQSPSFGSVPGDAKASGGEIDAAEYFGDTYPDGGLAAFTYFRNKAGESQKYGGMLPQTQAMLDKGDAWWKRYHVFSVQWTPDAYVFRVDGEETLRQTTDISGAPEFLVLSLLTSDWELPHLDESTLPADMKVDWVRVWQQKNS